MRQRAYGAKSRMPAGVVYGILFPHFTYHLRKGEWVNFKLERRQAGPTDAGILEGTQMN